MVLGSAIELPSTNNHDLPTQTIFNFTLVARVTFMSPERRENT